MFSQRHAVLVDYSNGDEYSPWPTSARGCPRRHGRAGAIRAVGDFTVRDSLFSEYAAVGFEYGYGWRRRSTGGLGGAVRGLRQRSPDDHRDLPGGSRNQWGQYAGVTLLLPHGYEGQGPEHTSACFERFVSRAARGNMRVAIPSTSAQYFHLSALAGEGGRRSGRSWW